MLSSDWASDGLYTQKYDRCGGVLPRAGVVEAVADVVLRLELDMRNETANTTSRCIRLLVSYISSLKHRFVCDMHEKKRKRIRFRDVH